MGTGSAAVLNGYAGVTGSAVSCVTRSCGKPAK